MDTPEFESQIKDAVGRSTMVLFQKAASYTDEDGDRFRNFKLAAELQHTTPIKALSGMMAKHTVKLYDLIDQSEEDEVPLESWDETIGDSINYLLLLSALIREGMDVVREEESDILPSFESDDLESRWTGEPSNSESLTIDDLKVFLGGDKRDAKK